MHVDKSNANIKIKKIDEETKAAIEGVTFEIRKENNEIIGTYTTDKNGEIHLKNIEPGIVKKKEIRTLNNYQLDNEEKKVNLIWGKESYIEMENRKIKGQIKIIKTSE